MSKTCLYIGRFQPFHVGHLDVVNQIFDYGYQSLVIGVGSINKQDKQNPYTFPQRRAMIEASLEDRRIVADQISIVGVPDFSEDEDWYTYIVEMLDFDVVMSGNQRVIDIFQRHDHEVLLELERIHIHGTDIRTLLARGDMDEAKKWVTPSTYELMQGV